MNRLLISLATPIAVLTVGCHSQPVLDGLAGFVEVIPLSAPIDDPEKFLGPTVASGCLRDSYTGDYDPGCIAALTALLNAADGDGDGVPDPLDTVDGPDTDE